MSQVLEEGRASYILHSYHGLKTLRNGLRTLPGLVRQRRVRMGRALLVRRVHVETFVHKFHKYISSQPY